MTLPPELSAIYAQARHDPDQNRALLVELEMMARMAQDRGAESLPFRLGPAPSHCQLCGQTLSNQSGRVM